MKIFSLNGRWRVAPGPAPADPGRDGDPARAVPGRDGDPARAVPGPGDFPQDGVGGWRLVASSPDWPDWMEGEAWAGYQAALAGEDDPGDPDLEQDPDNSPPPGLDDAGLAVLLAGAREVPLAGFAEGGPLDGGPGCVALMGFADAAAGEGDRYPGACDDELVGAVCAWDRVEAHAAARKHAAVAELIRRRPEPGCAVRGRAQMPVVWDEFTPAELAAALAESEVAAGALLDRAWDLQVKLPATMAAFLSGVLRARKVDIIARAAEALDPAEARAAEALVLGRAARLTPGGLRSAIARAVLQVAPEKARRRREDAARDARVERWPEDSGNAALAGRELPPAEVLAADQRVTWWARQLKKAGLAGDMDQLRARAFLDILLDVDSRPARPGADTAGGRGGTGGDSPGSRGGPGDAGSGGGPVPAGPGAGVVPAGFAGRVMLTVPLATLLGLADRPGEIPGIGPVDPGLARDLAGAAARNPRTTWCVTVTDQDGHATGHGCARPASARPAPTTRRISTDEGRGPGPPDRCGPAGRPGNTGPAAGGGAGNRDGPRLLPEGHRLDLAGPGFSFTASGQDGPPGGYGTWRLSTGAGGRPDLIVALEPIAAGECDHRHQAKGHDPGVLLRHLTQVRHATCTGPACRRPAERCDFEHNIPYQAGGRTCLCNGDPKCRHDHRLKQDPRWNADMLPDGSVRWTTPSGRQYTTEPTRYPI